ncbi:hypothetical protein SOPP22_04245 [Shewanella sp. OPT22]|nr:hypothetical protein SOPP22_04245 [Shewanella sp. OPT22]
MYLKTLKRALTVTPLLLSAIAIQAQAQTQVNDVNSNSYPKINDVQTTVLQAGTGYELKQVTYYSDDSSRQQNSTLFYIHSVQGAMNAVKEAGLSKEEEQGIIDDYSHKNCDKNDKQCLNREISLIVVDKGVADHLNDSPEQFNSYIQSTNLQPYVQQRLMSLGKNVSAQGIVPMSSFYSCNSRNQEDFTLKKDFDQPYRESKNAASGNANLNGEIDANFHVGTKAQIFYSVYSKLCIPHRVEVDKVVSTAKYSITGNFDIHGSVAGDIKTWDWDIKDPVIGNGGFKIANIPFIYDVRLPISAGVGDIHYQANGEVGLKKQLDIEGEYQYECTKHECKKIESTYNDNGLVKLDDIRYQALGSISLTPHINLMLMADVFNGYIHAQAGIDANMPVNVTGYVGNDCGNGNGLGADDAVYAGFVNVDLHVNAAAEGHTFNKNFIDKSWPLVNKNVLFRDIAHPSSALSPIIRSNVEGQSADLSVGLRSCVGQIPSSYQNYVVDWGDGQSQQIDGMNGGTSLQHSYTQTGDYKVTVKHKTGPSTTLDVNV